MTSDKRKKTDLLNLILKSNENNHYTLGKILKQIRLEAFLTQQELAEQLDIKRQQIQKYEYDIFKPSSKRLQDILDICDCYRFNFSDLIKEYYL